jgi:DNA (cytosine-5)-methyltransferase 1
MHSQGQGWDVVPQRRRRVFVVACRGPRGWADAAKVFFKPESLSWHPPSRSKKGKNIADDAQVSPGGKSKFLWSASDQPNAERYIDKAGTLNCNNRQRGGYIVPTVIDRAAFNQVENAQYEPHIEQTDIMDSLVAKGPHAVGVPFIKPIAFDTYNQSVANTNQAIGSSASDVNHYGAVLTPDEPMVVRRLTPRETERLQGFPDDWSMIPWKGKSADQCPDGPRYRACGNSMAVPVMRYIGGKIDQVERESK